uniref:Uncharacterized protein n=1 Tax=Arundo donax TaxID=35708 RepID=A0A0A8Z7G1_ARUDO
MKQQESIKSSHQDSPLRLEFETPLAKLYLSAMPSTRVTSSTPATLTCLSMSPALTSSPHDLPFKEEGHT